MPGRIISIFFLFNFWMEIKIVYLLTKAPLFFLTSLQRNFLVLQKILLAKPVRFDQDTTFYVSGIFKKMPDNSSQQFDFVLSFEYFKTLKTG